MQTKITRKDFLKGAALGFTGIAALGMSGNVLAAEEKGFFEKWAAGLAPVDTVKETLETDVLVVGAGNAGVYAACSAAEAGASVILIDKSAAIMTTRGYIGMVNTAAQKAAGVSLDANALANELCRYGNYRVRQDLIKVWTENSGMVMDWAGEQLKADGYSIVAQTSINENAHMKEYPTQHAVANAEGKKDSNYLSLLLSKFPQINTLFETSLHSLIRENDRVSGAIVEDYMGNFIRINAKKGVILCAGGYCGNMEMLMERDPEMASGITQNVGHMPNVGEGICAGLMVGAAMDAHPSYMIFDRGGVMPGMSGGKPEESVSWGPGYVFGSQPFMMVNKEGKRFVNESLPYDFKAHAAWQQPGDVWVQIWDSNWKEDVKRFNTVGCSRIEPSGCGAAVDGIFGYGATENYLNSMMECGALIKADTLEELAEGLMLPAETLKATVERYNALYEAGEDLDYGKESFRLSRIATPPFYGMTVGGQLLCTMDGLMINDHMQVVDESGAAIPGLYAAGNNAGGFFAGNYPELVVGVAVGKSITFGYLAGKEAAKAE